MSEIGLMHEAATGFNAASISVGDVPSGSGTDGQGLIVEAASGEGTLAILSSPVPVDEGPVFVSVYIRANQPDCAVALAAFNSPVDGQLGYTNACGPDVPVDEWKRLSLLYDPPSNRLQAGIQVAAPKTMSSSLRVYFDNLQISSPPELTLEDVVLDVDGTFDGDTSGLLRNVNGDSGRSLSLPAPAGGKNVVLSIVESDNAANIGVYASDLQSGFPHLLQASVDAQLFEGSGGVTALVMTNGHGNVGLFVNNSSLPAEVESPSTISIGGGFGTINPDMPILCVVQNGGPDVESTVIVDNLIVQRIQNLDFPKRQSETPLPTKTPTLSTPTPPDLTRESITVPLDLPVGAKPLEMVLIPAGTFMMGSPEDERGRDNLVEWPPHQVTITEPFYLGMYEVTQAQWEAVMGSNPAYFSGKPNNPIEQVSWNMCQEFVEKLNGIALVSGEFRLPTEAEWEYACRSGTMTRFSFGDTLECSDTGEVYCELANQYMWWRGINTYGDDVYGSKEVGLKLRNRWGLYDMHGNVWEWCSDWYGSPYHRGTQIDPIGPPLGSCRILRGGSWHDYLGDCRAAYRRKENPSVKYNCYGIRLAKTW